MRASADGGLYAGLPGGVTDEQGLLLEAAEQLGFAELWHDDRITGFRCTPAQLLEFAGRVRDAERR